MPSETIPSQLDPSWKTTIISSLDGGLNTTAFPDLLMPEESTSVNNLSLRDGRVRVDIGSTAMAGNNVGHGKFRTTTIHLSSATKTIFAITDETVLVLTDYGADKREWQYAVVDGATAISASHLDYRTTTAVAHTGSFPAGIGNAGEVSFKIAGSFDPADVTNRRRIGITLTDGHQHQANIVGWDSGTKVVTINNPLPSNVELGDVVVTAPKLKGTIDKQVSTVSVPWGGGTTDTAPWVVFTNGADRPLYFNGSKIKYVPNLPYSGDVVCEVVTTYKGTLILGNCVLSSAVKLNTILWSDIGDPEEWLSNNSGQQDILEQGERITALRSLGPDMIVYGPRSVTRMTYAGSTNFLFAFAGAVSGSSIGAVGLGEGIGCVSANAVYSTGDSHLFMAPNGIYRYTGGYSATRISESIHKGYFGSGGSIDETNIDKTFTVYLDEHKELYFLVPVPNEDYTNTAIVVDMDSISGSYAQSVGGSSPRFRTRVFAGHISGAGVAVSQERITWNTIERTWEEQVVQWDYEVLLSDAPTATLGASPTNGIAVGVTGTAAEDKWTFINSSTRAIIYDLTVADMNIVASAGAGATVYVPVIDSQFSRIGGEYIKTSIASSTQRDAITDHTSTDLVLLGGDLTYGVTAGSTITGTGIEDDPVTTVVSITNTTTLVMSQVAESSVLASSITFTAPNGGDIISFLHGGEFTTLEVETAPFVSALGTLSYTTLIDTEKPLYIVSNALYTIDFVSPQDFITPEAGGGTDIPWTIETKDFTGFDKELRTDLIDLVLRGVDVDVSISRDGGSSFTSLGTATEILANVRSRFHSQGVGDKFRFRISGSGGNAEIGSVSIRYREEDRYRLV